MSKKRQCRKCKKKRYSSYFDLDSRTKDGYSLNCDDCGGIPTPKKKEPKKISDKEFNNSIRKDRMTKLLTDRIHATKDSVGLYPKGFVKDLFKNDLVVLEAQLFLIVGDDGE